MMVKVITANKDLHVMPPKGRLLLCYAEEHLTGIACLKYLAPGIGEIKRMYVRPGNRKRGQGRALLNQLVTEATQIGYERIRLDSARFMKEAHHLYQTTGFSEIEAYEGSEIPKEFDVALHRFQSFRRGQSLAVHCRYAIQHQPQENPVVSPRFLAPAQEQQQHQWSY
jgi:N-acetylglutamate synthase-like GNAT family acetyltransferase